MSSRVRFVSFCLLMSGLVPLANACATGEPQLEDDDDAAVVPTSTADTGIPLLPGDDASTGDATAKKDSAPVGDGAPVDPAPKLTALTPSKSPVATAPLTVKVTGTDFTASSVVEVSGTAIATTFTSATELQATIPAAVLGAVASLPVVVVTPAPGGGKSAALTFSVENPAATTTSLSPLSAVVGSPATLLTVTGTGFVTGSKIVFNGTDLATTLKSPTSLEATIPAAQLATPGTFNVTVVNPAPGGGTTAPLSFTVSTPAVQLSSVTPANAIVGAAATNVQLVGTGFLATTQVLFNGTLIASTFVDATRINATIPAGSLGAVGDFPITARNPPPGGGTSAPVSFRVQYGAPTLASIAPASVAAGSGPTVVTLTGSTFYPATQVTFNGVAATTTFVSSTQITATLTAAQLASGGSILVAASTPAPGGGTTGSQTLTVQNPAPVITNMTPASVTAGSGNTTITITGSGFVAGSSARANGTAISTSFVNGTTLNAVVPAAYFVNPGTVSITVLNAAPGGGTSGAFNLAVGCNTTGVDVSIGAINNETLLATNFAGAAAYSRISVATTCPATVTSSNPQPVRSWIVQNTSGSPFVLSAWAVCSSDAATGRQDDAFMTFYRRATVPTTDADRAACTGFASEGTSGAGAYASPASNGSNWCPGLTKANNGGITLAHCERAVVQIQPWSNTSGTYTPPPQVRIKGDAP